MSSGRGESPWAWLACTGEGWLRSLDGVSRDKSWLKTSKSSLESETSMIPSSSLVKSWDEVASSLIARSDGNAIFGMPFGMGSTVRKPGTVTLIWCKHRSFALIAHFGAW